jgi:hypothetical protein
MTEINPRQGPGQMPEKLVSWRNVGFVFNLLWVFTAMYLAVQMHYIPIFYGFAVMAAEAVAYHKNRTTFLWEFFCVAAPVLALFILSFKKRVPEAS